MRKKKRGWVYCTAGTCCCVFRGCSAELGWSRRRGVVRIALSSPCGGVCLRNHATAAAAAGGGHCQTRDELCKLLTNVVSTGCTATAVAPIPKGSFISHRRAAAPIP